jgi:hypothetical protein
MPAPARARFARTDVRRLPRIRGIVAVAVVIIAAILLTHPKKQSTTTPNVGTLQARSLQSPGFNSFPVIPLTPYNDTNVVLDNPGSTSLRLQSAVADHQVGDVRLSFYSAPYNKAKAAASSGIGTPAFYSRGELRPFKNYALPAHGSAMLIAQGTTGINPGNLWWAGYHVTYLQGGKLHKLAVSSTAVCGVLPGELTTKTCRSMSQSQSG